MMTGTAVSCHTHVLYEGYSVIGSYILITDFFKLILYLACFGKALIR